MNDFERDKQGVPDRRLGCGVIYQDRVEHGALYCSIYCWRCGVLLHKDVSCLVLEGKRAKSCEQCETVHKKAWEIAEMRLPEGKYHTSDYSIFQIASDLFLFLRFPELRCCPGSFYEQNLMKRHCKRVGMELPKYDIHSKKWSDQ